MTTIKDFELIDHGIEHSQYFQGCGVTCASFENVAIGIGDNPAEAINDCLGQIATQEGDLDTGGLETRIKTEEKWEDFPRSPSVCGGCEDRDAGKWRRCETCEIHYYVSIRWN